MALLDRCLIRLQHQNHAVNRGFPLHPSLKITCRHELFGLVTFDLLSWKTFGKSWLCEDDFASGRVRQELCDLKEPEVFARHAELIAEAGLIFIDGPKDIVFEQAVFGYLREQRVNHRRIVVFDDIKGPFVDRFWRSIDLPKLDITSFGNWNGTGIVELPNGGC